MKFLIIIASLAMLAGCATQQPGSYSSSTDPREWRTVSVTNVDLPPDAPRPENYTSTPVEAQSGYSVTYRSDDPAPAYTYAPGTYYSAPVVVAPQPWYGQPQVSIGLGFGIGRHGWIGINQHFGSYPHFYSPYRAGYDGHRHMHRHHGWRHHGPRHPGGRRHR